MPEQKPSPPAAAASVRGRYSFFINEFASFPLAVMVQTAVSFSVQL
jgi:hypothetical protein